MSITVRAMESTEASLSSRNCPKLIAGWYATSEQAITCPLRSVIIPRGAGTSSAMLRALRRLTAYATREGSCTDGSSSELASTTGAIGSGPDVELSVATLTLSGESGSAVRS